MKHLFIGNEVSVLLGQDCALYISVSNQVPNSGIVSPSERRSISQVVRSALAESLRLYKEPNDVDWETS